MSRSNVVGAVCLSALLASSTPALAARRQAARQAPAAAPAPDGQNLPQVTPALLQQQLDSWELVQAQQQLKITDDQFAEFLRRFKNLLDIRRKWQNERQRHVNQLRMLTNAPTFDEAAVTDGIKAIKDLDARVAADEAKAYDLIDQVLDIRQRARFRVFEENMERQKLDLITTARRQAGRGRQE
ncbi:MAG TPA: hypothetical protein VHZ73_05125 [Vicinamibacterales bacterium]|nr:hypothetical protein [Vicinamibacterales bacterium]